MKDSTAVESFTHEYRGLSIPVYAQQTKGRGPTQVVFIMHGVRRNAKRALRNFALQYKGDRRVLFLAPEFSDERLDYPAALSLGNMSNNSHINTPLNSPDQWLFGVIDEIMARVTSSGDYLTKYSIFGHSAGAQFVHRLVIFGDTSRLDRAVAANAGWYTTIDPSVRFPYGFGEGSPAVDIENALRVDLTILLGDSDTNRDKHLRTTANAESQGETRLDRGRGFYEQAMRFAKERNIKSRWQIDYEPGVGHDSRRMASAALEVFFG